MDAFTEPLERVVQSAEWFVNTRSLRVLYVQTDELLRDAVLRHLVASEELPENTDPWLVLETPFLSSSMHWQQRIDELQQEWSALMQDAPKILSPAVLPVNEQEPSLAGRFAQMLSVALQSLSILGRRLVVVLAPIAVENTETSAVIEQLITHNTLRNARWVVVDDAQGKWQSLVTRFAPDVEQVNACVDHQALQQQNDALVDAMESAPRGAIGPRFMGAAGPDVAPPVRVRSGAVDPQKARVNLRVERVAYQSGQQQLLQVLWLKALRDVREQHFDQAVEKFVQAQRYSSEHQLHESSIISILMAASMLVQQKYWEESKRLVRQASEQSLRANLPALGAQAELMLGCILQLEQQYEPAAAAMERAGLLALEAKMLMIAIEAFRSCGQVLASQQHWQEASTAFRRAIETAQGDQSLVQGLTSAPQAALQLAGIYRQHGSIVQAEALEQQAEHMQAQRIVTATERK